jgi:hypothetical protein
MQSGGFAAVARQAGERTVIRERLEYLEPKVPYGIVRCGVCGWLIRKGSAWTVGGNGPQHEVCEFDPCSGGPPGDLVGPRLWSQNWGAPFDDD